MIASSILPPQVGNRSRMVSRFRAWQDVVIRQDVRYGG